MNNEGTVTKTHRLPPKLAADLKTMATKRGTSENHEMTTALRCYVDTWKREGK